MKTWLRATREKTDSWTYISRNWPTAALLLFALVFWWTEGLYGVNPTDDGYFSSLTWRLLHGEIPHLDFTSPRPVMSAFIHLPEALLPSWNLAAAHLVTTLELLWISIATVRLVFQYRITNTQRVLLIIFTFLLNVGTWPLMTWHTIDGVFISVTAIWFASISKYKYANQFAWVLAGIAPLVKQGFLLVPFMLLAYFLSYRKKEAVKWAPLATIFPVSYLILTARTPDGVWSQLYTGSQNEILKPFISLWNYVQTPTGIFCALFTSILSITLLVRSSARIVIIVASLFGLSFIIVAKSDNFTMGGAWIFFFVETLLIVIVFLARTKQIVTISLFFLGLGISASMSWGAPSPNLLAGSLAALTLGILISKIKIPLVDFRLNRLLSTLLLLLVFLLSTTLIQSRLFFTYADQPKAELTEYSELPFLRGMHLSGNMAVYLDSIQQCLQEYPSKYVVIIPDGGFIYPAFGIRNPFETDWWLPQEEAPDHAKRISKVIEQLNQTGDWLVLFQSFSAFEIPNLPKSNLEISSEPFAYNPEDIDKLSSLDGSAISCNSFTGMYSPAK